MKYLDEFLIYGETERNFSKHTIKNYRSQLVKFFDAIQKTEEELETKDIRKFIAKLTEQKRSTVQQYLMAIKSYYKFLIGQGSSKMSTKHLLILNLFYGLGGRVAEVASLKVEDIDFEEHTISLIGKGNKERCNPIDENTISLIKVYMHMNKIKSGYLFPHRLKRGLPTTTVALFLMVKTIAKEAGIDPTLVSPHKFRHTYAELLGHDNISTTRIYSIINLANKKDRFMKYHPLAH